MQTAIVQLDHVSLIYHDLHAETLAINDLSFTINRGEFVALVGPSGCGKTSVLSLLAGLLNPSSGKINFVAKDSNHNTGYMLQHDHLLPWRTIEENVMLGLEVKHMRDEKYHSHALQLLERYGLIDFRNHYPKQLSGGMRQKVALIRTLAFDPLILLLDEPFSALDYQTRLHVSGEVAQIIRQENKTAVLVTHDIAEAVSLADRVLVFSSRPAHLKSEHVIHLPRSSDSIVARNTPDFQSYFNTIWKELQNNE